MIRFPGHTRRLKVGGASAGSELDFVCFRSAGSTGRRNTGAKSLRWGFVFQGLTWPFVELTGGLVQLSLRVHRQVGSFRKVLPQQTVSVLIGTTLPGALWIAEVDINIGRERESSMIRKLLPSVPGQGLIQLIR